MKHTILTAIVTMVAVAANAQQAQKSPASAVKTDTGNTDIISLKNDSLNLNALSIVTVSQPVPFLKSKKENLASGSAGNVNSVAVFPGLTAGVEVGQVTVLGGLVKAGKVNSVGIGSARVTQVLPDVAIGVDANKDKLIDIGLKGGLSLTLPLIKLHIPYPKFGE